MTNQKYQYIYKWITKTLELFTHSENFIGYAKTEDDYMLVCNTSLWEDSRFQGIASDFLIEFEEEFSDDNIFMLPENDAFAIEGNSLNEVFRPKVKEIIIDNKVQIKNKSVKTARLWGQVISDNRAEEYIPKQFQLSSNELYPC